MADYDFTDRVAFVTGAARGQGRSHAVHYAANGADVVVTDVCETIPGSTYELSDEDDLAETARLVEERGSDALALPMDVTDEAAVEAAVDHAIDEFGRIDILANNAGISPASGLMNLDEGTWDATLDVNLKGMWLCSKHVGNRMIARGEGGRIVNTSSMAGYNASPGLGHYSAAKHGVLGLTKALAAELAPHGITVNAVSPSAVGTPMLDGIIDNISDEMADIAERSGPDNLLGEILEEEDVSAAFMWLSSDDARFVTGISLPVAGGATTM